MRIAKDEYHEQLAEFEILARSAASVSDATTGREADWWIVEGSHIFAKLALYAVSICRLAPSGLKPAPGGVELWDLSSMCTLVRAIVDAYSALYYIAVDGVGDDEREFRRRLWVFHSEFRRLEMLRLIGSVRSEVQKLQAEVESLKAQLIADPYYSTLPPKVQSRVRDADLALHLTNSQIAERAGVHPQYYKALYRYLSNYTHTYGLSVNQLAAFRAGDPKLLRLIGTTLSYGSAYLALGIRDFVRVIPEPPPLSAEVRELIAKWEHFGAHTVGAAEAQQTPEEAPSHPTRQ